MITLSEDEAMRRYLLLASPERDKLTFVEWLKQEGITLRDAPETERLFLCSTKT